MMQVYKINEDIMVFRGDKLAESKYRQELSKRIIEKFGYPYYETDTVSEVLYFCREYYIEKFEEILSRETSYKFYHQVHWLNEQASVLRRSDGFINLPKGLDKSYIAIYRRILKLILEHGCSVQMVTGEKVTPAFRKRIEPIMDDLLFLGEMFFDVSESIAEQEMIEDAIDVDFDTNGLYKFTRRHHYEIVFTHINKQMENDIPEYVIDDNGTQDYKKAIKECFGFDHDTFWGSIALMMEHFKIPIQESVCLEYERFRKDLQQFIKCDQQMLDTFLAGLTLSATNKLSIHEVLKKPYSLNRFLTRPFLVWTVNNKPFYIFSIHAAFEAEESLYYNAIPWQKVPSEWEGVPGIKTYASRKHDEHDRWLDDKIEQSVKDLCVPYQRKVEKLVTKTATYTLLQKDLGEIDFLIVSPANKKVYVAECKHLMSRYDMVNQRNDHAIFLKDTDKKDAYVTRLNRKVKWIKERMDILQEHFQLREGKANFSIEAYEIEGVFFINTPTFLMYNCDVRIYTHDQVSDLVSGNFIDPIFYYVEEDDESSTSYKVSYPFFRKPKLYFYENPDDDCEVDKYGDPIRKKSENDENSK